MLVIVALGGNALLRRGEPFTPEAQLRNLRTACSALAPLAEMHRIVVTHGNGPQVGLLALQAASTTNAPAYPLDVLGAESEGMIGYLLEQELRNALPDHAVAAVLTQVVVDAGDPAFENPTKPIGPVYGEAEARRLARERRWTIAPDGGDFRRVVASPAPRSIVEIEAIRLLVDAGVITICAGGGGIPVVCDDHGLLHGVEAVIDKDLTAALLGEQLGADFLLMLTDVAAVEKSWGTPEAAAIREATPDELRAVDFASGSMAPKVEAACRFVEAAGGRAGIGALEDAALILAGRAGTSVRQSGRLGSSASR